MSMCDVRAGRLYRARVVFVGAILLIGAMGLGVLGLVKRGYELIVAMTMLTMLFLGFVALAYGLLH